MPSTKDTFIYTIVDPENEGEETKLEVRFNGVGKPAGIMLNNFNLTMVDSQQLTEIAALFLAMSGGVVDYSSADELLEGYGLSGKRQATELSAALEGD